MEAPETFEITVNGQPQRVVAGTSLVRLLDDRSLDRRFLVVEYNGKPLGAEQFDAVVLAAGDKLELVRPVAGG